MSEELAIKLNHCMAKGYVIAPAGYGKTHLIALAVRASSGRQLILTHTFAGVNSIKTKTLLQAGRCVSAWLTPKLQGGRRKTRPASSGASYMSVVLVCWGRISFVM
jgi:hypothetical protein